jgi:hypothetical protein
VALNRSKLAAIILGGLALLWFAGLFFGLPFLMSKKMTALVGHDAATVEREIGPPTQRWTAEEFACDPTLPCQERPAGGPVYLYADKTKKQGWYLFFDDKARLAKLEPVGMEQRPQGAPK